MAAIPFLDNDHSSIEDEYDESEKLWRLSGRREKIFRKERICRGILALCLFSLTIGISTGVAVLVVRIWQVRTSGSTCIQTISAPSPVTRDVDIEFEWQQFNGSFMEENIYRQDASPEVDAAWEAMGTNYRVLRVSEDIAGEVGLAPDRVQISQKYGGGYVAGVEGLHHLHCLNMLRQGLYYNIDYYRAKGEGAFKDDEHILRKHISHCLDTIRQQLMCTVDIGVMGQVWFQIPKMKNPSQISDFNTRHVCRNFEAVRRWAEERQLPEIVPDDYLKPPNSDWDVLDHAP